MGLRDARKEAEKRCVRQGMRNGGDEEKKGMSIEVETVNVKTQPTTNHQPPTTCGVV